MICEKYTMTFLFVVDFTLSFIVRIIYLHIYSYIYYIYARFVVCCMITPVVDLPINNKFIYFIYKMCLLIYIKYCTYYIFIILEYR